MAEVIISVLCCNIIMGFLSVFRTSLIPFLPSSALTSPLHRIYAKTFLLFSFSVNMRMYAASPRSMF